ncbi:MAG TPA: haloacid dehalogenase-like hydrolase [Chitinophagaceae bacterium]
MDNSKGVILLDVCDTLFLSNTTFDFIKWYLQKNSPLKLARLRKLTSRKSPEFWYLLLLGKLRRKDLIREKAIALLKGESAPALQSGASQFYDDFLANRKNKKVWDLLDVMVSQNPGKQRILVSSSLDIIIVEVAKRLGIEKQYASKMEMHDGKFTGRLASDVHGQKHVIIQHTLAEGAATTFFTDNFTDLELAKQCGAVYIVTYKQKQLQRWSRELNPSTTTYIKMFNS